MSPPIGEGILKNVQADLDTTFKRGIWQINPGPIAVDSSPIDLEGLANTSTLLTSVPKTDLPYSCLVLEKGEGNVDKYYIGEVNKGMFIFYAQISRNLRIINEIGKSISGIQFFDTTKLEGEVELSSLLGNTLQVYVLHEEVCDNWPIVLGEKGYKERPLLSDYGPNDALGQRPSQVRTPIHPILRGNSIRRISRAKGGKKL
jgi:hypothetical protein